MGNIEAMSSPHEMKKNQISEGMQEYYTEKQDREEQDRKQLAIERLKGIFAHLTSEKKSVAAEAGFRACIGFLGDRGHVENQQIDLIDANDEGKYEMMLKLTESHYKKILKKAQQMMNDGKATMDKIVYKDREGNSFEVTEAINIPLGRLQVKIATANRVSYRHSETPMVRSALGLVRVEIPSNVDDQEVSLDMQSVLNDLLELDGGLEIPEKSAEREYKVARYAWHHKKNPTELLSKEREYAEKNLVREEVFPGYHTMVEHGKSGVYEQKFSRYAIFHETGNIDSVRKIVRAGGFFSTHERYRRGLLLSGMSSTDDMDSGGADYVFTRTVVEKSLQTGRGVHLPHMQAIFVFASDLFDRTDWFTYSSDQFGSTSPEKFSSRLSPDQFFRQQIEYGHSAGNEQMFRTGIPLKMIKGIVIGLDDGHADLADAIKESGLIEIGGISVQTLLKQTTSRVCDTFQKAGIEYLNEKGVREFVLSQLKKECVANLKNYGLSTDVSGATSEMEITDILTKIKGIGRKTAEAWMQAVKGQIRRMLIDQVWVLKRDEKPAIKNIAIDEFYNMDFQKLIEKLEAFGKIFGRFDVGRLRETTRDEILFMLESDGISEINGKSIEDFVQYAVTRRDLLDIASGKKNDQPKLASNL